MKFALKWLGIATTVYVIFVTIIIFKQRDMMYFPFGDKRPNIWLSNGMKVISVKTEDGLELESWYEPPKDSNAPVIVMFHGNGQSIAYRPPKVAHYREKGYGVLLAEYRGYGGNPGKTTEEGVYKDGRAYINWLIEDKQIPEKNIVLYGESLGSGIAVQMATEYDTKALLLDVPFNSTLAVAKMQFFFIPFLDHLMWDQYRNDLKISDVEEPIFMGIAGFDLVVPSHFGKELFDKANEPKTLKEYPNSGHMDLHYHGYPQDVVTFLESLDEDIKQLDEN